MYEKISILTCADQYLTTKFFEAMLIRANMIFSFFVFRVVNLNFKYYQTQKEQKGRNSFEIWKSEAVSSGNYMILIRE